MRKCCKKRPHSLYICSLRTKIRVPIFLEGIQIWDTQTSVNWRKLKKNGRYVISNGH